MKRASTLMVSLAAVTILAANVMAAGQGNGMRRQACNGTCIGQCSGCQTQGRNGSGNGRGDVIRKRDGSCRRSQGSGSAGGRRNRRCAGGAQGAGNGACTRAGSSTGQGTQTR